MACDYFSFHLHRYLCLQKKVAASEVFETYTKKHPNITKQRRGPPFLLPLLNFLWLLLSTIERFDGMGSIGGREEGLVFHFWELQYSQGLEIIFTI